MKKYLIITTAIFFGLLVLINSAIFKLIVSGPALVISSIISWAVVAVLSVVSVLVYTTINKTRETEYKNGKKTVNYFKNMWITIILISLFSFGMSCAGGAVTSFTMSLLVNRVDSVFLNGAIFVIPAFVLYLVCLYKNFVKLGFLDSQKQVFNLYFKILTLILLMMFVMPSAIFGNIYSTYYFQAGYFANIRSVFSFNIDLEVIGDYVIETTEGINIISSVIKTLLTLAIEMSVVIFAYIRGKAIFVKRHLKNEPDYKTDEFMQAAKNEI